MTDDTKPPTRSVDEHLAQEAYVKSLEGFSQLSLQHHPTVWEKVQRQGAFRRLLTEQQKNKLFTISAPAGLSNRIDTLYREVRETITPIEDIRYYWSAPNIYGDAISDEMADFVTKILGKRMIEMENELYRKYFGEPAMPSGVLTTEHVRALQRHGTFAMRYGTPYMYEPGLNQSYTYFGPWGRWRRHQHHEAIRRWLALRYSAKRTTWWDKVYPNIATALQRIFNGKKR
jgi:hypothetical protein